MGGSDGGESSMASMGVGIGSGGGTGKYSLSFSLALRILDSGGVRSLIGERDGPSFGGRK